MINYITWDVMNGIKYVFITTRTEFMHNQFDFGAVDNEKQTVGVAQALNIILL